MSTELERRVSASPIPLRSEGRTTGADGRRLIGYAAVFGSLSENMGGMREIIEPGAFSKALRTSDVRALLNHDPSLILGRTKSGTLRLKEDSTGLRAEIDLPKTPTGDGVLESVRRGDISQMSFAFRIAKNGDRFSTGKDGVTVRRIVEVGELVDVSPVAFPAYADTVISARALAMAKAGAPSRVAPPWSLDLAAEQRRLLDALGADAAHDLADADRQVEHQARQAREVRRERHLRILGRLADNDAEMRWMERAALHEAAHALGYYLDGAGIEAVGLLLEDDPARCTGGYARCVDVEAKSAQSILAGIAAERLSGHTVAADVTDKDVIKAKRAMPLGKRSHEDVEREIRRATDMLTKRWHVVRALAREIVQRIDLTGDEAETVIARALGASIAA